MQFEIGAIKSRCRNATLALFGGRIARTTYVLRVIILGAVIAVLVAPLDSILAPSSQTVRDLYGALSLALIALCLLAFFSTYVKRLHDIGLRGYWAIALIIGLPLLIMGGGSLYIDYRYSLDATYNTAELVGVLGYSALGAPLLLAMWRGESGSNRFGPAPEPVEHIAASPLVIASVAGAAAILIPTSIYAGLFQSGVWVGRGRFAPSMPMIDSMSSGRLLAKCWNIKGVGAGTGDGSLSGVYRDGFGGSVLDFLAQDNGDVDVVPAGETLSKAYRADGFDIYTYGLKDADGHINLANRSRFLIAAVYDGSGTPDGGVNFTTFSFARTGEIWPEWQMIMSTGMNLGPQPLLERYEQARGRLMVADCVVR